MNFNCKMTLTRKHKHTGFTIIEMIITVALLAVMLAVGVPTFGNLFQNNTLATTANRFVSSVALTRSEAINRNATVIMCNTNALNTASDTDGAWESGWIIWVDSANTGVIDNGEIIYSELPMPAGYTLRATTYANVISFAPTGEARGDAASAIDTFRLCDNTQSVANSRTINFNTVGRTWVTANPVTSCP